MGNLDFISKLLDGRVVLGSREEILPNLYIIPVYKVKISFFNLSTDLKNNTGDGSSGSLNVTPICLLEVKDDNIKVLSFADGNKPDSIENVIPNIFSNLDINGILKNIKLEA